MTLWEKACKTQGNIAPGIVNKRISNRFILKLSQELRSKTFQFTPGRGIQITQAKGAARPPKIAYTRDMIVQEAIRILLNVIYNPTFLWRVVMDLGLTKPGVIRL
jgi:retron-type reverse transcriptase